MLDGPQAGGCWEAFYSCRRCFKMLHELSTIERFGGLPSTSGCLSSLKTHHETHLDPRFCLNTAGWNWEGCRFPGCFLLLDSCMHFMCPVLVGVWVLTSVQTWPHGFAPLQNHLPLEKRGDRHNVRKIFYTCLWKSVIMKGVQERE